MVAMAMASVRLALRRRRLHGLRSGALALALLAGLDAAQAQVQTSAQAQSQAQRQVPAQAFDRQAQTQRFARWVSDFQRDFRKLDGVRNPTDADIERIFADTIVPGSRAVTFVRQMSEQPEGSTAGGIAFAGPRRLVLSVLRQAVVAGDGGPYTDAPPGKAPQQLRAWYLHIDGGGMLEPLFADREIYTDYRLPATGTLEREVYPFLLFQEGPTLRLGAITREFWAVIQYLDNKQHG